MLALTETSAAPVSQTPTSPPPPPSHPSRPRSTKSARRLRRSDSASTTDLPAIPQRKASLAAGAPLHNRYIDPTLSLSAPGPSSGLQPSPLPKSSASQRSVRSAGPYSTMPSPQMDMYRSSDSDSSSERRVTRPRPSTRRKGRAAGQGQDQPKRRINELPATMPSSQSESASVKSGVIRRTGPKRQIAPPVAGARKGLAIAMAENKEWDKPAQVERHIEVLLEESRKANQPAATYTSDLGSGISSESARESSPPLVGFHSPVAPTSTWPTFRDSTSDQATSPLQARFAAPFSTLVQHDHQPQLPQEDADPVALHEDHIIFPQVTARPSRSRETSRDTHSVASSIRSADSWSRAPWSPTGAAAASPATTVGTPAQSPASFRQARSAPGKQQAPAPSSEQSRKLYFPSPPPKAAARQAVARHLHEASPPGSYAAGSTAGDESVRSERTASASPARKTVFPGPPAAGARRQRGQTADGAVESGSEGDNVLDAYFAAQREVPASRAAPSSSVFARTSVFPSKSLYNPRSAPMPSTAVFPSRPTELSFRSITSSLSPSNSLDSVAAPLQPVAESGQMQVLLHQKRVSRAPWEDGGDELDWIVAAQKKLEPKVHHSWLQDESEEDHLSSDGLGPKGQANPIRKSLEPALLSETLSMMDLNPDPAAGRYEPRMLSPVLGADRRASTCSTMSGQSEYVDALPEVDEAEELEETAPRKLELAPQQTSTWVLDALAAGTQGHSLSAIGEADEHDERAPTPVSPRPLSERRNTANLSIVSPPQSPVKAPEMMRSDTNGTVVAPAPVPTPVPTPRTAGSSSSGGFLHVPLPSPGGSLRSPTSPEFDYGSFPPVPMYQHSNNSSLSTSTNGNGGGYVSSSNGGSKAAKKVLGALFKNGAGSAGRKPKLGGAVGSHNFQFTTSHAGISSDSLRSSADSFSTGRGSDRASSGLDSFRLGVEARFGAGADGGGGVSPAGEELEEEVLKTEEMRQLDERMERFKEEERERFRALVRGGAGAGRVAVA